MYGNVPTYICIYIASDKNNTGQKCSDFGKQVVVDSFVVGCAVSAKKNYSCLFHFKTVWLNAFSTTS